ncbi:MAG TPA: hypothetical protein VHG91_15515 [Longimicrobium sp.]|nr:hypothetical protein [Longimicrobium sp.]
MPTPGGRIPVDALREAVRRAVEERRIRSVANEIGISVGGLHRFLKGSVPRASTQTKLLDWHVRSTVGELPSALAAAYLHRLLDPLGGRLRDRTLQRLIAALREGHRRQGTPPPAWLDALDPEGSGEA